MCFRRIAAAGETRSVANPLGSKGARRGGRCLDPGAVGGVRGRGVRQKCLWRGFHGVPDGNVVVALYLVGGALGRVRRPRGRAPVSHRWVNSRIRVCRGFTAARVVPQTTPRRRRSRHTFTRDSGELEEEESLVADDESLLRLARVNAKT